MATQPIGEPTGRRISVDEYLHTVYEPDCEYEDGKVVERNLGEFEHAFLQTVLATLFTNHIEAWGAYALTEQRVQIGPRRFLVPDVCVLRLGDPADNILRHPPLIVIEIMSPEDTKGRLAKKVVEYLQFGVEHVWIIDPIARAGYQGTHSGLKPVPDGAFAVAGTPIRVQLAELFAKLDRIRPSKQAEKQ